VAAAVLARLEVLTVLATGASKVKSSNPVPTISETLTRTDAAPRPVAVADVKQETDVTVDQDAVLHPVLARRMLTVISDW
jgi:hypothetical protein